MSIDDERERVWSAIQTNGDRITQLRDDMTATVKDAVREAMPSALLSDEQHRWVELAIRKEAQSIAFRQSVIDKTLVGLIWAVILGAGIVLKENMQAHGWKP